MTNSSSLKIAYIGGGSRDWARKLMIDLALCPDLTGEVALYDIDLEAARLNEQLGNWIQSQSGVVSQWHYSAVPTLKETLHEADFVIISIQLRNFRKSSGFMNLNRIKLLVDLSSDNQRRWARD